MYVHAYLYMCFSSHVCIYSNIYIYIYHIYHTYTSVCTHYGAKKAMAYTVTIFGVWDQHHMCNG